MFIVYIFSLHLFSRDKEDIDCVDVIKNFVKFVSKMCLAACVMEKQNALFEMCVLDFLDLVSERLASQHFMFFFRYISVILGSFTT